MDAILEILKLKVDVATLKMAVALPQGKSLNPAYRQAEDEYAKAVSNLEAYKGMLEL